MEQFTIRGFKDILENSSEYKSIESADYRLVLLDRCNWYISFILKTIEAKNKPLNHFVNINSNTLKNYLGNRVYKSIQKCLIDLSIIYEKTK
jgi:hypothetical protein